MLDSAHSQSSSPCLSSDPASFGCSFSSSLEKLCFQLVVSLNLTFFASFFVVYTGLFFLVTAMTLLFLLLLLQILQLIYLFFTSNNISWFLFSLSLSSASPCFYSPDSALTVVVFFSLSSDPDSTFASYFCSSLQRLYFQLVLYFNLTLFTLFSRIYSGFSFSYSFSSFSSSLSFSFTVFYFLLLLFFTS